MEQTRLRVGRIVVGFSRSSGTRNESSPCTQGLRPGLVSQHPSGVRQGHEADAREVLGQGGPATIEYGEGEAYVQPTCPKCGSAEISLGKGTERGLTLTALYLMGIPLPARRAAWHCEACGAEWVDEEDSEAG